MVTVLIRERQRRFKIHREEGHVKTEAEIRVMQEQTKECLETPGKVSPLETS